MIYKEVTFQKVYNLGNYSSERIEILGILEPGETVGEGLDKARAEADANHKKNNVGLYLHQTGYPSYGQETPDIPIILKKEEQKTEWHGWVEQKEYPIDYIKSINSCTSVKVLESYKFIVKGKLELQKAYDDRMVTLLNEEHNELLQP